MNKKSKILIFASVFAGLLVLYFGLFHSPRKRFDWSEEFVLDKEKPFGTWLVSELLKEYDKSRLFKELNTALDESLKSADIPSNYIFIGQEIYLEDTSTDSLFSFVSKGNKAFIFTSTEPSIILQKIVDEGGLDSLYFNYNNIYSDSAFSYFGRDSSSLKRTYHLPYSDKWSQFYYWNYIENNLDFRDYSRLGTFEAYGNEEENVLGVNYYSIKYKKGTFYFHTQPILFTNNVLKEGELLAYTNRVFSYLNEGPILWEEHNWRFNQPNKKTWLYKPGYYPTERSPLDFILSNPSLKWGWYLLLLFIVVFVLFNGKRRMGIISVLPNRKNTSLEHIQLVSELYNQKDNHYAVSAKLFGNFLSFLRNELRINTNQDHSKIIDELILKTQLNKEEIDSIFNTWRWMGNSKVVRTEMFLKFNEDIKTIIKRIKQ